MTEFVKVDANTIGITKQVVETQTYKQLLGRKANLIDQMAHNAQIEAANRAVNQAALDEVNALIAEADRLGVVEAVEIVPEEPIEEIK